MQTLKYVFRLRPTKSDAKIHIYNSNNFLYIYFYRFHIFYTLDKDRSFKNSKYIFLYIIHRYKIKNYLIIIFDWQMFNKT